MLAVVVDGDGIFVKYIRSFVVSNHILPYLNEMKRVSGSCERALTVGCAGNVDDAVVVAVAIAFVVRS